MRRISLLAVSLLVAGLATAPCHAGEGDAAAALDRLKSLAGTWTGVPEGQGEAAEAEAAAAGQVTHVFQVSAAGTVVMETMNPGTEHEMINMYHLDGDDLVLTHYCAGGNQPRMRWVPGAGEGDSLVFDFDGGTNLAAGDPHIHNARITFDADGTLDSVWSSWAEEKPAGGMAFHLSRVD